MLRKYLLYGICSTLLTLGACNRENEEVAVPSYVDANWFCIPDKPGEYNQLAYEIYTETGVPLFVNDTLGQEYYAKDAEGNPIIRTETFNLTYMLFGNTTDQTLFVKDYIVQSADTSAMVTAANLIRKRVIPHLPKKGIARPKCYFLLDSLNTQKLVSFYSYVAPPDGIMDTCVVTLSAKSALKGVAVGELHRVNKMSEKEQCIWCGKILGVKVAAWLLEYADLSEWYKISEDAGIRYETNYFHTVTNAQRDPKEFGMFRWYIDRDLYKVTLPQEQDIIDFVAYVYAYRGQKAEFMAEYGEYRDIVKKFDQMCDYVSDFEREFDVL